MQTTIEKIQRHAKAIAAGELESVRPGMAAAFTEACVAGDAVRQGDLYLIIVEDVPSGYVPISKPKAADKQLVPGNTDGARHCLDAIAGVKLYRPKEWGEESLDGPCFVLTKPREVLHPVHGPVAVPAGFAVLCRYQREFDKELQKERRARD
jgi:hypothetical protein